MRLQTAIDRYVEFISNNQGKKLKDASFIVKWRLRFSKLGWLSIMTWKLKWVTYKTNCAFRRLSPEQRKKFNEIIEEVLHETQP